MKFIFFPWKASTQWDSNAARRAMPARWPLLALTLLLALCGCERASPTATPAPSIAPEEKRQQPSERFPPPIDGRANTSQPAPGTGASAAPSHGIVLTDVTETAGVDFVHYYDGHDELLIVEPVASGMATVDFDLDGLLDLYFLNGASIPAEAGDARPNGLFRNLGEMRFASATDEAGADDRGHSLGVAVADFDGDGFADIYVNNFGPNVLYRNNGDGTFSDATAVAGVDCGNRLGAGVCFFDADGDGLVDLYVGNYVKSPIETNVKRTTDGFASYPGPLDFEPDVDFFFRNQGDGTFADRGEDSGIGRVATTSMGVIAGDFDDDADVDLIVVNDVDRNLLFLNDGTGVFEEIGIQSGVAFSYDAQRNGNMGIDCADYNQDGFLDLYTTTFSNDLPVLYRNDGFGNFEDVTQSSNAGEGMLPHANWGTSFLDLENDGDKDLIIANGHTSPNVHRWAYNTAWKVANTLLLNNGRGRFQGISDSSGSGLAPVESSRGLVTEDFDNDGDMDIVILNALAPATVIRNDSSQVGNWLHLEFHGRSACRDATGIRVTFEVDGKPFVGEVHSGRGYQSSYGQRLHFGLGSATSISEITIRWTDGTRQVLEDVPVNQRLSIVQPPAEP